MTLSNIASRDEQPRPFVLAVLEGRPGSDQLEKNGAEWLVNGFPSYIQHDRRIVKISLREPRKHLRLPVRDLRVDGAPPVL